MVGRENRDVPQQRLYCSKELCEGRVSGDLVIGTPSLVDVAILSPPLGLEHQAQTKALYP